MKIKSFRIFESKYSEPEVLDQDDFNSLGVQELSKSDISALKIYFAQFGSKLNINDLYCQSTVGDKYFSVRKLEGDDEWFLLSVYTNGKYSKVSDRFAALNMHKPEFQDKYGQSIIIKGHWYYVETTPKPGYEGKYIISKPDKNEYFKCDQIGGVIEKIDEYLKRRSRKDPNLFFDKVQKQKNLTDMRKSAASIVSKWDIDKLEDFLKKNQ